MKTRINQLVVAALFALIMLSSSVSAKGTTIKASDLENVKEQALVIENWMINKNFWDSSETVISIADETEENLELESWMTNGFLWNTDRTSNLETETEPVLSIEPWMLAECVWEK